MFKMTNTREHHADVMLVAGVYRFLVTDGAARLHNGRDTLLRCNVHTIPEREIRIRSQHGTPQVKMETVRVLHRLAQGVHAGGLSHAGGKQLLVYTDGLNEAENPQQELLGNARLLELMANTQSLTSRQVIDMLLSAVEQHRAGASPNDDLTLMCINYKL